MKRHTEAVHKKKKPFDCDICDYRSSEKGTMKKHVYSVHENKKPFKCDICDYRCSRRSNLKRHVESVHEKKNHSNVSFVSTAVLKNFT